MKNLELIKSSAIKAVKKDGRLIADVADEFGISRRELYRWLNVKPANAQSKSDKQEQETKVLKAQLKILQTEVSLLKSQLNDYQITETLKNGRIVLDLQKNTAANHTLQQAI